MKFRGATRRNSASVTQHSPATKGVLAVDLEDRVRDSAA